MKHCIISKNPNYGSNMVYVWPKGYTWDNGKYSGLIPMHEIEDNFVSQLEFQEEWGPYSTIFSLEEL